METIESDPWQSRSMRPGGSGDDLSQPVCCHMEVRGGAITRSEEDADSRRSPGLARMQSNEA